ncbi:LIM domain transcription factor LMO4.1-like [Haliotis rubra]|uniref:LIM domain transcription factor LMO4.1-like n=1 Tax=Haliotis rubra TaxID=36100 RepID=UPI001EE59CC8|nr:LIM domain transcription factor LMO4.1-like [Haliotis rubra]
MDPAVSAFNSMTNGNADNNQLQMNGSLVSQATNNPPGNGGPNGGGPVKACGGCGARIVDRFLLHALDRYWHTGCLKCSCCQAQLGEIGTSCFTKAGMILCRNDYIRLFGSGGTCAACSQNIPASELVMRVQGNVYHLKCFTCVSCHGQLVPGDRFSIVNGSLLCEQDYPKVLKGHASLPARTAHKVC